MAETGTKEGCTYTTHMERLIVHPVNRWRSDHSKFALLLDLLEQQVDAMHKGRTPNYELTHSIVHYLRHNPDRFHHPREDIAFARMVERDPDLQPQVARRMQEHVVIAAAGEKLLTCLKEIMTGPVTDRAALEAAAGTYWCTTVTILRQRSERSFHARLTS